MTPPSEDKLRQRYEQLPTPELVRITVARPGDYTPLAIEIARQILDTREKTLGPEELQILAQERIAKPESFWVLYDKQRGASMRAGWLALLLLMGFGLFVLGLEEALNSGDARRWSGIGTTLVGLALLGGSIAGIIWEKRRQAHDGD